MRWFNEPPEWTEAGDRLDLTSGERTDFWRETHYGFVRDSGHFRYAELDGDFEAHATFGGEYTTLYDQAGLMVRVDERHWLKAGVEFVDGRRLLSCVVTRDYSDWSLVAGQHAPEAVGLRVRRIGTALHVDWRPAGLDQSFEPLRLAYLPAGPARVGPVACSPERSGFRAWFTDWSVIPPVSETASRGRRMSRD